MPIFRNLSLEELHLFEQEFREYLAVNGIDAELWKKIKDNEPSTVEKHISSFSDVIYNLVLTKMEYIVYTSKNDIKYFCYGEEKAELIGLESEQISFTNPEEVIKAIEQGKVSIRSYRTTKKYSKKREAELFTMLKNGCQPDDGKMFKLLEKLV